MKPAKALVTTPALKYGPTRLYGRCEDGQCDGLARRTCTVCGGEFCLGHCEHPVHSHGADRS